MLIYNKNIYFKNVIVSKPIKVARGELSNIFFYYYYVRLLLKKKKKTNILKTSIRC